MKLRILAFKETGKLYLEHTVSHDEDIPMFRPEFKEFIRKNAPALPADGYIAVLDEPDNQTFHTCMFRVNHAGLLV